MHWCFKGTMEQSAAVLSSSGKWDSVRPAESTRTMESNILWPSAAAHSARSQSPSRGKGAQHLSCWLPLCLEEALLSVGDMRLYSFCFQKLSKQFTYKEKNRRETSKTNDSAYAYHSSITCCNTEIMVYWVYCQQAHMDFVRRNISTRPYIRKQ